MCAVLSIPVNLAAWATRHGVTPAAFVELRHILGNDLGAPPATPADPTKAEGYVQSQVRLEASDRSVRLWRNNVGALVDERGVPVRYGLANDSKALNEKLKSSDLIGWRPRIIGPDMVGTIIAQFVARECKRANWRWSGDAREVAQQRWISMVLADGGDAAFATGPGTL